MIKYLLIWLFLLDVTAAAHAQSIILSDTLSEMTIAQKDTVRAIHRLFQTRRRGASTLRAIGITEVGVGSLLVIGAVGLASIPFGARVDGGRVAGSCFTISLPGLALGIAGLIKGGTFRRQREDELLLSYRQGQALPIPIHNALKEQYFLMK